MNTNIDLSKRRSPDTALGLLFPYSLTIIAIMVLTHLVIVFAPAHIFMILSIGTAFAALLFLTYTVLYGKALDRLRFGGAIAHALTYAVIVSGNLLHLFLLLVLHVGTPETQLSQWFGPTIAMGAIWGIGLIIHLLAVIGSRGFETHAPAVSGLSHPRKDPTA